jgi:copper resistance protein D
MRRQFLQKQTPYPRGVASLAFFALIFVLTCFAAAAAGAAPQQPAQHDHAGHEGMNMPMDEPLDPAAQAKLNAKILADKAESEFNHHLAGFFVAVAGLFILFQSKLVQRWPAVKYVWPSCFLLAGLFVFVWSDTELWPFGHRHWLEALRNNREVLQHKTFAVLLVALGTIEWQRARGVLKASWSNWVFPAIAVIGSVLLIFHEHEGGMAGERHMETMQRIQTQHMSYLMCGLGIGLANGLSELGPRISVIFRKIWPTLMVLLGVLLMFYKE